MKALSIRQPWAWLICAGYKDVENRDWRIGRKPALGGRFQDRGLDLPARIYVHAGKSTSDTSDKEVFAFILRRLTGRQAAKLAIAYQQLGRMDIHYGAIIGEVDIIDCVEKSDSPWFVGKYGFVLANPVLYEKPIPCRGALGFFEPALPAGFKREINT